MRERAAATAGSTARALAATSTPAASTTSSQAGTTGTATIPMLSAHTRQTACPAATPSGTPAMTPIAATALAWQNTTVAACRRTKPSAISSALSPRRRVTLATSW
jgi:hypothetical protein